jgi:hypothetical protein
MFPDWLKPWKWLPDFFLKWLPSTLLKRFPDLRK